MTDPWNTHSDLHRERGGLTGEHPSAGHAFTISWKSEIQP